jgi:hypothetical protein
MLRWYALYVLIAGGVFGVYLVCRLWLRDGFFKIKSAHHRPRHREVD